MKFQESFDYIISALIGFSLSLVLIKVASLDSLQQSAIKKKNDDHTEDEKSINSPKNNIDSKTVLIDEEKFVNKSSFLLNTLGVSTDQIRDVVKKTNEDIKNGITDEKLDNDSSFFFGSIDLIVYVVLGYFIFYSLNVMTQGELGRILTGLFPTEIDSLNLRKYFEKFRYG
jgi:hypothetical protein